MKIRRHIAVMMYQQLGTMALGHLENETLESVIDNFNAFRKVAEDFDTLKEELHKVNVHTHHSRCRLNFHCHLNPGLMATALEVRCGMVEQLLQPHL